MRNSGRRRSALPRKIQQKKAVEKASESSAGAPFWSGTLSFGLVTVLVQLFPAARNSREGLRLLGPDGQPLERRYYSQKTGRDLDPAQTVRGFEYTTDKYVMITDDELERLQPEKSRDIDLIRFVQVASIPPIYFERGYLLTPVKGFEKPYILLAEAMRLDKLVGLATFVMRGKEHLIAIISENGILRAETLRFADELRTAEDLALPTRKHVPAAVVRKFEALIAARSRQKLSSGIFKRDESELIKLVKRKRSKRGNVIELDEEKHDVGNVIDLVAILKRSLAAKRR